jgi:hypothetical protein
MTIEKIEYRNGAPGDDIYVTLAKDGQSYSFCVEVYLTGPDTDVYKAFETLKAGDIIFTGTPSGVMLGYPADKKNWLKSGDTVEVTIEGIGTLKNVLK